MVGGHLWRDVVAKPSIITPGRECYRTLADHAMQAHHSTRLAFRTAPRRGEQDIDTLAHGAMAKHYAGENDAGDTVAGALQHSQRTPVLNQAELITRSSIATVVGHYVD